ncbi:MAG TPA: PLP-dependent aminotransferase family protein [Pseudogracilibacillus sp.]|nr:PLP-dependent aminotransferase family protein [Pseudogracilibacillus sp.]
MLYSLKIDKQAGYIYQQIYQHIKQDILSNHLQAHEKLRSKRKLAEQLEISVNSVTSAYEQLVAEGYIYTKEKQGYYVEEIVSFADAATEAEELPSDLVEQRNEEQGVLSFSHMTADVQFFPMNEWLKAQRQAIAEKKSDLASPAHFQGPYVVRQTIAALIKESRAVDCEPEQIVIGPGTQMLIRELTDMLEADTVFGMERPGYHRIYEMLKGEFTVQAIDLDEDGINVQNINEDVNYLFVTPSHQFPTGVIMPISRRIELLNWSIQSPLHYIIEDDYDSEFKYETDNIPSLQSLDHHQKVIYVGSFSKTLFPGLRISYMVLPPALLRKYRAHHYNRMQDSNLISLYTLHYFIKSGAYAKHLKRMNNYYEKKRQVLVQHLKNTFAQRITVKDIPAGLHFLAAFTSPYSYEQIRQRAYQEKLEIYPITRFLLNQQIENNKTDWIQLVIGFANIEIEDIPEAVVRLYHVVCGFRDDGKP